MRRQNGFAFLGFAIVLAAIAITFIIGEAGIAARAQSSLLDTQKEAYLDMAAQAVESWYARNAAAIDAAAASPFADNAILALAGIERRWNLRVAQSARLADGDIAYRRILLWLPAANPDPSTWDAAAGTFSPGAGVRWRIIDGRRIQSQAYSQTLAAMRAFARKLELRFYAKAAADSSTYLTVNWFRPRGGCASPNPDDIPCLDAYTDASLVNWRVILGEDPETLKTAWGQSLLVSNLTDSSASIPPYTMAIAAQTPWGAMMRVLAVQPI